MVFSAGRAFIATIAWVLPKYEEENFKRDSSSSQKRLDGTLWMKKLSLVTFEVSSFQLEPIFKEVVDRIRKSRMKPFFMSRKSQRETVTPFRILYGTIEIPVQLKEERRYG